ncbi:MAG: 6-bladed beta-propeller [Gracilimonas sp.]|uniref:6-bladed beta-propeller n=1 Tax=Gracilimonas sp. TaxID=1974203 RepID=UPI0037526BF0|nr:6-bladed beta-propeller [Gracilimonas sp.]
MMLAISMVSCEPSGSAERNISRTPSVPVHIDVVIGEEDQPFEHLLGNPIGVCTDSKGNIYIADKASLKVKVFDSQGNYLRSFGGRGRGPGEFLDINLMQLAGDDTLLFQDRGKLEFIYMTTQGEYISSHPVNLSNQYYPKTIKWNKRNSIGLMQKASPPRFPPPPIQRPLFYVYDKEFQTQRAAFFPFNQLGYTESEMFVWSSFIYQPGSFDLLPESNKLIYSPGVYIGKLYEFIPSDNLKWTLQKTITAYTPSSTYEIYNSEAEYESMREIPGVNMIRFVSIPSWGRLYSIDAGVYYLNDGKIAHFFGEWRGGDKTLEEGNTLDISVQILDDKRTIIAHSYLFSLTLDRRPSLLLVNWKDNEDNFYLLNLNKDDVPKVTKFRLDLDGIL